MSVVQHKVSVRSEVPFFGLTKVNPVLSLVHGKWHHCHCQSGRWSTCARWIQTQSHMTKCRLCEKNKQLCIGLPRQTCNECTKAKAKCDKLLGRIGRRKDMKVADTKGKAPGEWPVLYVSSAANRIVVHSTGVVIWILPLQPVVLMLKTVPLVPDLTAPATPLFLGDLLSLPEIETLWVDKSEADSAPLKRLKTDDTDKEHTAKIAEARLAIAMCKSQVHSAQAFLKDLEVWSLQMAWFVREQIRELEQLKGILDEMDEMWGTQSCCVDSSCYSIGGPLSFFLPHVTLQCALEETGTTLCQIMPWLVYFSFHYLVTILFLGQEPRSRSTNLYLWHFPF